MTLTDKKIELLLKEIALLKNKYDGLHLRFRDGKALLVGELNFTAVWKQKTIIDSYRIEIWFSDDYPNTPPRAFEIGGKIEKGHHKYCDETLCLGVPVEIYLKFNKNKNILFFIEELVIPYLYAYSYKIKWGEMPWGERHGDGGVIQYYIGLFKTLDLSAILALLKIIIMGNYQGNSQCSCGGKKTLNECHGEVVFSLWQVPINYVLVDYVAIERVKYKIDEINLLYRKF